jgi:hypothetical protein
VENKFFAFSSGTFNAEEKAPHRAVVRQPVRLPADILSHVPKYWHERNCEIPEAAPKSFRFQSLATHNVFGSLRALSIVTAEATLTTHRSRVLKLLLIFEH